MPTMVEIPGVGEVEFPDGMTLDQIQVEAGKLSSLPQMGTPQPQPPQPESSILGAASRGAGEQILGNIAALPDVVARGVQGFRGLLAGQPGQALEAVRTEQIPTPSGREINAALAGVEALPAGLFRGEPIEAFRRAQSEERALSEQAESERPFATNVGQVGGDALTMLGLRVPGVTARAALPAAAAPATAGALTLPRLTSNILRSAPIAKLGKVLGRSGEAAAEGAVIAALNDNDPLFTAAASAGAQAIGTLSAEVFRTGIGKTFIGLAALMLAAREAIPGFDPGVFDVVDIAANKVGLGLITGLVTALPAARLSGRNQTAATAMLLDAVSSMPRNSMQSMMDGLIGSMQSGTDSAATAARQMLDQAATVTDDQVRRFERAVRNGDVSEFDELAAELAPSGGAENNGDPADPEIERLLQKYGQ